MPKNPFAFCLTRKLQVALAESSENYITYQGQHFRVSPPDETGTKLLLGPHGIAGKMKDEKDIEVTGTGFEKEKQATRVPKAIGWDIKWQSPEGPKVKTILRSETDPPCNSCGGTGFEPGPAQETPSWTCESCQGTGLENAGTAQQKACTLCKGEGRKSGKKPASPKCKMCYGAGVMNPKVIQLVTALRKGGRAPIVRINRQNVNKVEPLQVVPQ